MNQREQQRLETRERIYDCAFRLFEKKPYDSVKVEDIAKAAGVSVGSVYYHFKSKDEIVDYGYFTFDLKLKEYYEKKNPKPGKAGIQVLIEYQIQTVIDSGSHMISITFKNQVEKPNTYLFSSDRFLYGKLLENVKVAHPSKSSAKDITDMILRIVRGSVYDWCERKGSYDLMKTVREELKIIETYYEII